MADFTPTALGGSYVNAITIVNVSNKLATGHACRGIQMGAPLLPVLVTRASKETTEGSPATPCLKLGGYSKWTFSWAVAAGARTITVKAKQPSNSSPYPSVVLKANSCIGIGADITGTSAGGTGWVTISPAGFTATNAGVVVVELWNNGGALTTEDLCYFDHIVVT